MPRQKPKWWKVRTYGYYLDSKKPVLAGYQLVQSITAWGALDDAPHWGSERWEDTGWMVLEGDDIKGPLVAYNSSVDLKTPGLCYIEELTAQQMEAEIEMRRRLLIQKIQKMDYSALDSLLDGDSFRDIENKISSAQERDRPKLPTEKKFDSIDQMMRQISRAQRSRQDKS